MFKLYRRCTGFGLAIVLLSILVSGSNHSYGQSNETTANPVVLIKSGEIQGTTLNSNGGREYYAYMGIPYAEPPVNQLRFKAPVPIKRWNGTLHANRRDIMCIQFDGGRYNDTENCLVLNVYTPKNSIGQCEKLLPVMVVFHEGAFLFGSGSFNFYDPSRFMDSDIVLVTTNYRLGVLGFLDTQDESSPGNYGMLDQVATLKWVKDNVGNFGGDPEQVSIFGCSAGGASVTYHLISPMSKGLFKSAMVQSGTAINPWAIEKDSLAWAKKVGKLVNCSDINSTENLVSCLRDATPEELLQARIAEQNNYQYPYRLGPSVQASGKDRFLTEHPLILLNEGRLNQVPVIIGITKDEAFDPNYYRQYQNDTRRYFEQDFCPYLNNIIDNNNVSKETCQRVQQKYFNSTDIEDADVFVDGLVKLTGDVAQSSGISKTAELLAKAGVPVQGYKITYIIESAAENEGKYVRHGDEMVLMFDRRWPSEWNNDKLNFSANDKVMSSILTKLWTTFGTKSFNSLQVEGRNGTRVDWPLYNTANRYYVQLDLSPALTSGVLCETMDFWEDIIWPVKSG